MDIKTIAIFLPFFNAILYGLYYVLLERNVQKLSMPTLWLIGAFNYFVLVAVTTGFKIAEVDFSPLLDKKTLVLIVAAQFVSMSISVVMYLALRYTSATYLAFGELAYPLFVPLFAWLLFNTKELGWTTAFGGLLIIAGSFVIVYGKKTHG